IDGAGTEARGADVGDERRVAAVVERSRCNGAAAAYRADAGICEARSADREGVAVVVDRTRSHSPAATARASIHVNGVPVHGDPGDRQVVSGVVDQASGHSPAAPSTVTGCTDGVPAGTRA